MLQAQVPSDLTDRSMRLSAAAAAGFDPLALSWVGAWYVDGPNFLAQSYADAAEVTSWADESGNGSDLAVSGTSPNLSESDGWVEFAAGDRLHVTPLVGVPFATTYSIVAKIAHLSGTPYTGSTIAPHNGSGPAVYARRNGQSRWTVHSLQSTEPNTGALDVVVCVVDTAGDEVISVNGVETSGASYGSSFTAGILIQPGAHAVGVAFLGFYDGDVRDDASYGSLLL